MKRTTITLSVVFLFAVPGPKAAAQMLDDVLPPVPGYGAPRPPTGYVVGGVLLAPSLAARTGFDSAPNGAAGSALLSTTPSLALADIPAGFGAFATAPVTRYRGDNSQNTQSLTLAAGDRVVLPRETVTLGAAYLRGAAGRFALQPLATTKPLSFALTDARLSDAITFPTFILTPELEDTRLRFPTLSPQDREDRRETLTLGGATDGVATGLLRLRATQSAYRDAAFNTGTQSALLGVQDKPDGLWQISLLAGAAWRQSAVGRPITAPVAEAGLDWSPVRFTTWRLSAAREIDDPDQISATSYTLTSARLSLDSAAPGALGVSAWGQAQNAAYLHSRERQTLLSGHFGLSWPLGPVLAATAAYDFNDRQSNTQGRTVDHIITLGMTWTP